MQTFFITGTDTGVGKTTVACQLLTEAAHQGLRALGFKPIASGATQINNRRINSDASQIQQASNVDCAYELINPFCFTTPIAPHFAAREEGVSLTVANVLAHTEKVMALSPDVLLIEGAGGWLLPLNDHETMADYVKALDIPVIVVIGMRLGCLNHALLTIASIRQAEIPIAGWIANQLTPDMLAYEENLNWLQQKIDAPLMQEVLFKTVR